MKKYILLFLVLTLLIVGIFIIKVDDKTDEIKVSSDDEELSTNVPPNDNCNITGQDESVVIESDIDYESLGYKKLDVKEVFKGSIQDRFVYYNLYLARYDFSQYYVDDGINFNFDSSITWPSQDKMPVNFDLTTLIDAYKQPGLGVGKLHEEGLNGEGITIAYIDQPLNVNHIEFEDLNLHYINQTDSDNSMHGPAVLSLLAGKNVGVAPKAEVYFIGHASWEADQRTHANALYELVEINNTLPEGEKIRMVGFSDNIDPSEDYPEALEEVVAFTEENGIMVFFCRTIDYQTCGIEYGEDIDDYTKLTKATPWGDGSLLVPTRRTVASSASTTNYTYFDAGGASWTTPYILGLFAIGLQINPELTKSDLIYYLMESRRENGAIYPEGFVKLVKDQLEKTGRYIFLYNSETMSVEDKEALDDYVKAIKGREIVIDLIDVGSSTIDNIYNYLSSKPTSYKDSIAGIQIFGTASDVPSFTMDYKVEMFNGKIDELGNFKTDYFYNNFYNSYEDISNFTVYDWYENDLELGLDLIPQWPVARLPLTTGEYANYFEKYDDYFQKVGETTLVNFSSPIFPMRSSIDDFSYFIKHTLDEETDIIDENEYRLYGNLEGAYPVSTPVLGGYTKENIAMENDKGIVDFMINTHGQFNNIDQAIFKTQDGTSEYRQSFLNISDVNDILDGNYYNLYLWTCNNGAGMNDQNIVHEMMANGLAVNIIASTTILSNNGVDNKASLDEMQKGNYYYYYYSFFKHLFSDETRSDSYYKAEKAYMESFIEQGDYMTIETNPQFALSNIFVQNYFGLLSMELANSEMNQVKQESITLDN